MIIVPDASIILKWVLPEEDDSAQALQIKDSFLARRLRLVVPSLWVYEVGNTLTRLMPNNAGRLLDALINLEIDQYEVRDKLLAQVLLLTQKFSVTFYDACYHALAIVTHGIFVTADVKYLNKTHDAKHACLLKKISDLNL